MVNWKTIGNIGLYAGAAVGAAYLAYRLLDPIFLATAKDHFTLTAQNITGDLETFLAFDAKWKSIPEVSQWSVWPSKNGGITQDDIIYLKDTAPINAIQVDHTTGTGLEEEVINVTDMTFKNGVNYNIDAANGTIKEAGASKLTKDMENLRGAVYYVLSPLGGVIGANRIKAGINHLVRKKRASVC